MDEWTNHTQSVYLQDQLAGLSVASTHHRQGRRQSSAAQPALLNMPALCASDGFGRGQVSVRSVDVVDVRVVEGDMSCHCVVTGQYRCHGMLVQHSHLSSEMTYLPTPVHLRLDAHTWSAANVQRAYRFEGESGAMMVA